MQKYGGVCECCNEHRLEFLTIHHKNEDGHDERQKMYGRKTGSYSWYTKLRKQPRRPDLQILCWCCHMAIHDYGVCPHTKERINGFDEISGGNAGDCQAESA